MNRQCVFQRGVQSAVLALGLLTLFVNLLGGSALASGHAKGRPGAKNRASGLIIRYASPQTNGYVTSTGPANVWVGQVCWAEARVPDGGPIDRILWIVPGNVFQSYNPHTIDSAKPGAVPVVDRKIATNQNPLQFRPAGRERLNVRCIVSSRGRTLSKTIVFDVKKPTSTLNVYTDSGQEVRWWKGSLQFISPQNGDNSAGIKFKGVVRDVPGEGHDVCYVQVFSSSVRMQVEDTVRYVRVPDVGTQPFVDNNGSSWDYPARRKEREDARSFRIDTDDTPAVITRNTDVTAVRVQEEVTMWLMYKAPGDDSNWVPLRKADWFWKGRADVDRENDKWTYSGNNTNSHSGQETTEFPLWSGNIKPGKYVQLP